MLSVHSSGLAASTPASRCSTLMPVPPPLERLTTTSLASLMRVTYSTKRSGSGVGRPSRGSRACRWTTAAPASAAASESSTISSGVTGRGGDIVGVCPEPVIAHVTMTLRAAAISAVLLFLRHRVHDANSPLSSCDDDSNGRHEKPEREDAPRRAEAGAADPGRGPCRCPAQGGGGERA